MIKFFLSAFMLLLMPLRLLFVLSILLNIAFFMSISSFVSKDNYFENADYFLFLQSKAEKALERSCNFTIKCSLKLYAKSEKQELRETFFKVINDEKQVKKPGFFENIKAPIQKILSENELKKTLKANEKFESKKCFTENSIVTCAGEEIMAIFTAENCENCLQNFEKEFKNLDKKHYKSFLIKISHKLHDGFFSLFGLKPKEQTKIITDKMKTFVYENM